jgi:AcrR family transcriptional regulator
VYFEDGSALWRRSKPLGTIVRMAASASAKAQQGGRGARERILTAATQLFYTHGIAATGVEQLAEVAHVSKRTLYQHFATKDDVVVAYLEGLGVTDASGGIANLVRTDVPARDRLIGVFTTGSTLRGCPFLNASAENADPDHPARIAAAHGKQEFIDLLVRVAADAGARNPSELGRQLSVLSDGAMAQSAALNSAAPMDVARGIASGLIDAALT